MEDKNFKVQESKYLIGGLYVLIASLLINIFFLFQWFSTDSKELRERNNELRNQVNTLQVQRDSLVSVNKNLQIEYITIEKKVLEDKNKLIGLDLQLDQSNQNLSQTTSLLNNQKRELKLLNEQIEFLRKNAPNRVGEELLISLRKKLNEQ